MTLMNHARICALISALALLAIGLGFFPNMAKGLATEWALAASASLIGGFASTYAMTKIFGSESGKNEIGNTEFERHALFVTVWAPVILSIFAIVAMLYFDVSSTKVGWVLTVVSYYVGMHLSSIQTYRECD